VWKEYSKAWNRLRTAAVKKKGRFSYARVLEHHNQSPYPHLHVIADVDFGDVWLAKELKSSGFGYQCRKVSVTTPEAVTYITKYLTKPWTDEGCKAVRKAMHLRIISFGGSACSVKRFVEPWTVVSRNCVRDQVTDSLDIDRTWLYGPDVKKLSERVVDAFMEEIYVLEGELLIVEVLNET
jgi:hypothetical protein